MIRRLRRWFSNLHPRRIRCGWLALTVAIGLVGAGLFVLAGLPLPWMLGPMVLAMVLSMAGVPVTMPGALRAPMLIVLGIMVGATITPELIAKVPEWTMPLLGLAVVMVAGTVLSVLYYRKVAGYDRLTAYYASVPGGLTEMILLAEARGADSRLVALSHAVRVCVVVLAVPLLVQAVSGMSLGARVASGTPLLGLTPGDLAWFFAAFVIGAALASLTRSITALFVVPLLVSGALHASGLATFSIPREAGLAAQLVIGLSLGCRFLGMPLSEVGINVVQSCGSSLAMLATAMAMALLVAHLSGLSPLALFLAYSPGGVAEMSLVAVALHIEVAFVVLHHLTRLLLVTLFARPIVELVSRHP